ncbi:hypothetical protein KTS45_14905 [Halomicroarcula limicola]|uniref:DUF7981 domain-containing protein n=1 Tax=Haloarcula limicola TaxID=1429915 RepID=A0A8J7YFF4_9EURY|nr:hypothetical protein [Halomicroarcula limicola]MBV0925493.1 hypothetical protein [Halomicroarcula limicola]
MDPKLKSSLLWGVVGGLAYLVLIQGYQLFASVPISTPVKFGVALVVAAGAAALTYAAGGGLPGNESP